MKTLGVKTDFPKKWNGKLCTKDSMNNMDDKCAWVGLDEELNQYSNVFFAAVFNLSYSFLAPMIWLLSPVLSLLLFIIPSLAKTKTNMDLDNGLGVPFDYYNTNIELIKILTNPFLWPGFWFELLIDYFHTLTYLFKYWREFAFSPDSETFPEIKYAGRSGTELSADIMEMYGYLNFLQVIGIPLNIFVVTCGLPAYLLIKFTSANN